MVKHYSYMAAVRQFNAGPRPEPPKKETPVATLEITNIKRLRDEVASLEFDIAEKRRTAKLLLATADSLEPYAIRLRTILDEFKKPEGT